MLPYIFRRLELDESMGKIMKTTRLWHEFRRGLKGLLVVMLVLIIAIVSIFTSLYLILICQDGRRTLPHERVQISNISYIHSNIDNSVTIYIYDLPRQFNRNWLGDMRCQRHLFAAEVVIHSMLSNSIARTLDPERADFFFLPIYVSCNFSTKSGFPQLGRAAQQVQAAINFVARQSPYWKRKGGHDHIFVATHDFGACFHATESSAIAMGIPRFMRNSIILQTFGHQGLHPCQHPKNSVLIPPYVSLNQPLSSVVNVNRTIWAYFRGKMEIHPRSTKGGGIYSKLVKTPQFLVFKVSVQLGQNLKHVQFVTRGVRTTIWQRFGHNKRFFIRRKRLDEYQLEMLRSTFCICPLGWAPWSPRIVEAVVLGCVPVIIADHIALPFAHVLDWPSISLRVPEEDVHKLDQILDDITGTNLTAIQRSLWKPENRQALLYNDPPLHGDASWQILHLLSKLKQRRAQSSHPARRHLPRSAVSIQRCL